VLVEDPESHLSVFEPYSARVAHVCGLNGTLPPW
jgi:hypothetical protein